MRSLLLAPHSDDETLFASYLILRHKPTVTVCLRSPGELGVSRFRETRAAMRILGDPEVETWPYRETQPLPRDFYELLFRRAEEYDHCFAPAVEEGGHEHHNEVGRLALAVFGEHRVTRYLTYTRHGGRSREGTLVEPEPEWVALKLAALACYRSQIDDPATRPWFYDLVDLREWVA